MVGREIFLPEPGHLLISADLSQVDARAIAAWSQDPTYIEIFTSGRDLHAEVAVQVFGDIGMREQAKAIGHGWSYGMSINGLVRNGVEHDTALRFDQDARPLPSARRVA